MSRKTAETDNTNALYSVDPVRRGQGRVWEQRLVWLLLFCFLGLWGYFFLAGRVDSKLTNEIASQLRTQFPKHQIFVDRAYLRAGESITIEGIRIAKPTQYGLRDVVRCGRLICSGPIELIGLVQGQLPVQKVIADGVEICVWPMSDGRMSVQELASAHPLSPNLPTIEVRSGLVRIGNETGRKDQEIICHDLQVNAALAPRLVQGRVMPISANIHASLASSFFSNATLAMSLSEDKKSWVATGRLTKLEYSQRLADQLPSCLRQYVKQAEGFSGELETVFSSRCDNGSLAFEVRSLIDKGRLLHPKLPYPLESICGEIYCRNGLIQLKGFKATSGTTQVDLEGNIHGLSVSAPLDANIAIRSLALDQRLYQALPAGIQETWRKLGVSGTVDAKASLRFDGQKWQPQIVKVQARDGGLEPEFFPYPIRDLNGEFIYQSGTVLAENLVASAGEQTLRGALTLTQAQPRWLMDLRIAADGPIPIDESLLKALSPRGSPRSGLHSFIHSLHPAGTVFLKQGHFVRTADRPDNIGRSLELIFSECSLKYDGFRYPVSSVNGQVTIENETIHLREFNGGNDGAQIKCDGVCQFRNSILDTLDLNIEGKDVGLDEELHHALPSGVRSLWDQIQPNGVLDSVLVRVTRKGIGGSTYMTVGIEEDRESESRAGRSVSIRPTSMPYQINDVACSIEYNPGHVNIRSFSGTHDSSRMITEGACSIHSDGTWDGLLKWQPLTRIHVDQSLLSCLPKYLRDPLVRLDFRGPVGITGSTRVASVQNASDSIVREWNLDLEVEDGRLGGGGIASGIRGTIRLAGENTPEGPVAIGSLELDGLSVKNIAVTGVQGPFAFNREELVFGRDAIAWQQKYTLRPSTNGQRSNDNSVVTAGYVLPKGQSEPPVQASFREALRDSLANRPTLIPRPPQPAPPDPNAVRASIDMPNLDTSDMDVRARSLSGTVFVSGVEPLDGQQRSRYRLRLVDADLHGCLIDLGESNPSTSGKLFLQCDVTGALMNATSLEGQGRAWLRNANLYELPAMIRLLQVLSVRPSKGAFDSADIQFGIDGERLPIHELNLEGNLISLRGSGWVNMRRELHLDLFANVGRSGAILQPFTRSSATSFWQVEVNGTTTDPQIRRSMQLMNSMDRMLPMVPSSNSNGQ